MPSAPPPERGRIYEEFQMPPSFLSDEQRYTQRIYQNGLWDGFTVGVVLTCVAAVVLFALSVIVR